VLSVKTSAAASTPVYFAITGTAAARATSSREPLNAAHAFAPSATQRISCVRRTNHQEMVTTSHLVAGKYWCGGMDLMSSVTAKASSASLDRAAPAERRWLVLVVIGLAQLMLVLDGTIVNIALPSAQQALGFSDGDRQWVVTAYALAFGSLLLVGGRLGDMFSRKWVFITGLVGFAVASAIGGAAGSFAILVAARALQGAFGAVLAPSALGTLVSTFTDPRERGRAFGVFGSVAAGGGAVGLLVGGVLTEDLSWRWCLYVNLVFAAVAVAGALAVMRGGRPSSRPQMDWLGGLLACAAPFAIVFGFSQAATAGWTAPLTVGSLVTGVVLLATFVVAERRVPHPLLPLRVIVDRTRGGAYVAVGISGMAIFGTFLFLTFYLQVVKGYSPLTTGLLFLPMTVCILISSNLSSNIGLGPRALIAAGMLLSAGGLVLLTQISVTSSYVSGLLPGVLILGLGLGLIFAHAINTATAGVAREDSGVASALVNTMQQVGGSIGTAALSTIALSATASYLIGHDAGPQTQAIAATYGYTTAFGVSAGLLLVGFLLAIVLLPPRRRLTGLGDAGAATSPLGPALAPVPPAAASGPAQQQPVSQAIPVALCSCSPLINPAARSSGGSGISHHVLTER
jgi:EmrB/QacA subfamily drug resistance transporter